MKNHNKKINLSRRNMTDDVISAFMVLAYELGVPDKFVIKRVKERSEINYYSVTYKNLTTKNEHIALSWLHKLTGYKNNLGITPQKFVNSENFGRLIGKAKEISTSTKGK